MSNTEDTDIPENVEDTVDRSIGNPTRRERKKIKEAAQTPSYMMVPGSKIPISKQYGKVWKARRDLAAKVQGNVSAAWEEAIRYFENDQLSHRDESQRHGTGNLGTAIKLNNNLSETENIVFANVTTMIPALYSRNPTAEFTATMEANRPQATMLERVVNTLGKRKAQPGFNMKPKARRCVATALLTNRAWAHINWTFKQDSSEKAIQDLQKLGEQLTKAKDTKMIKEIEGRIHALELSVDILHPEGPVVQVLSPFQVLFDPSAQEVDLSDAMWAMHCEYLPTSFLLAKYAKQNKGDGEGEYKSIYAPTHILKMGIGDDVGHDTEDYHLISSEESYNDFGFDSEEDFQRAAQTKVWYVWDKVTRRLYMYHDNDWSWPIWVWDDPLRLDTFFPYYPLTFFESPKGPLTKGEVTYYLDQQDAVNEISDEMRRARAWARRNLFFDSNRAKVEDVEAVLNGPDGTARGINVPEGMKGTDIVFSIPTPSTNFIQLFDKAPYYNSIDRLSSVGQAVQGAQFKANTTNDAVQANVSAANMRIDEKSDQIEDWIGQVYWGVAQLCLQFMSNEQVTSLIGEAGVDWKTYSAEEIAMNFNMEVVGGSSKKPTSAAKKEEALEMGQVLGQFVNAAPGPVLKIMLEMMQQAFDEINIKDEDWTEILNAVTQQQQAGPQQPGSTGTAPVSAEPTQENIDQILAQMSPQAKEQVAAMIQQGVPAAQALQQVLQQTQQ